MEPSIKLVTDLMEVSHLCEASLSMKCHAGGLLGVDAGNDRMVAYTASTGNQVSQQGATDAFAVMFGVHIQGVFNRSHKSGTRVEATKCPPT